MSDDPLGIKNLLLNDLDLCGNNFYLQDMVDNENIFFSTNLEDDGNSLGTEFQNNEFYVELEIITQPQPFRHFRYMSEFKSGSLSGEKKVPITVKVNNYVDGCFIRCSLVDFKTKVNHPYCLVEKGKGEKIIHDQTYYEVPVDPINHTAKLENIEIIVSKDKNKHAEIIMKKEKRDGNENTPKLLEQINKNLENIDLNVVALCFQAFCKTAEKNVLVSEKIYSNAIRNSHNSSTAKLEIAVYRVFKNNNYDEVWIVLKKKINIDKLEIKFYEDDLLLNWQVEKRYLHQAVIIIWIPSDWVKKVKGEIKIELHRTTDKESAFISCYTSQCSQNNFQIGNTTLNTANNYAISEWTMETDGLDENYSFNSFDEKSLFKALIFDEFEKAKEIITRMIDDKLIHDSDCQSNIKEKTLHLAISKNQPKIVKKLLDMGVDPNMVDENENTALHLAIEASAYDCINELLKYKDKINFHIYNEYGYMPLHLAIKKNSLKIVKALVKAGAQINSTNRSNGKTCLEMAQHHKQCSILKYLQAKDMTSVDLGPSQGSKYSQVFERNSLKNNLKNARIDQMDHLKFLRKQISVLRYTCIFLMTFILIIIVCYIFCNYLS
uniref:RHD domain-containing protein n=1 Tax=Trichogramma kaykai TaxID=54128 RepID=A0ABD2X2Y4_9HYME